MSISLAVKSAIGVGTVGCVASSVIGANYWLSNKGPSIPELIKSKNPERRLLDDSSSDEAWKASWKLYRAANKTKDKDIWSVEGWTIGNPDDDEAAPASFKRACKSKISGSSSIYDKVINYCTRKTILADLVKENSGRRLLVKVNGGNTPEWKIAWAEYKKQGASYDENAQSAWKITDWSSVNSGDVASDTFMDKCKVNSETEGYDPNAELYKQLLKYCTT